MKVVEKINILEKIVNSPPFTETVRKANHNIGVSKIGNVEIESQEKIAIRPNSSEMKPKSEPRTMNNYDINIEKMDRQ